VGLVGAVAVVVDGHPSWGSDFGGVLALVPAFAVLGLLAARLRLTVPRVLATGAAAALLVGGFALLDYARPARERTHVGRFVDQLLDGSAGTVVTRKLGANLDLLTSGVLTLLVPLVVTVLAVLVLRPPPVLARAYALSPALRPALIAVAVLAVLGTVVNDSGIAVAVQVFVLALPLTVAVVLRAAGQRAETDAEPPR